MDKKTFLLNLRQSLSVLQEEELQDIVSEYEQHIDMKVEKGLTEEEAIADFGSMTELTAEILEAYHVRADYAESVSGGKAKADRGYGGGLAKDAGDLQKEGKLSEVTGKLKRSLEGLANGLGTGFSTAGTVIKCGFLWGKRQISRPFLWIWGMMRDTEESEGEEEKKAGWRRKLRRGTRRRFMERRAYGERRVYGGSENWQTAEMDMADAGNGIFDILGGGISRVFHGCVNGARWCIRLVWNLCCVGASLLVGFFGLFCLYGLGVMLVLLSQGYPLAGVTLGCLGLVLCTFSLVVFGFTLVIPNGQKEAEKEEKRGRERGQRKFVRDRGLRRRDFSEKEEVHLLETDRPEKDLNEIIGKEQEKATGIEKSDENTEGEHHA